MQTPSSPPTTTTTTTHTTSTPTPYHRVGGARRATEDAGERAVLRLTPRPDRVVVFSGQLLHRSTPPTAEAPATASLPALLPGVSANRGRSGPGRAAWVAVPKVARWRYTHVVPLVEKEASASLGPSEGPGRSCGPRSDASAARRRAAASAARLGPPQG